MAKVKSKARRREELMWMAVAAGATMLSTSAARSSLKAGWKALTGNDAPENPAARKTSWREAMLWAVASGVAIGVANVLAQRGAVGVWRSWQGDLPPGL